MRAGTSSSGDGYPPTAPRFGSGRIAELPRACDETGIVRPSPVTGPGLAEIPDGLAALTKHGRTNR
jgi:hypothetical protein